MTRIMTQVAQERCEVFVAELMYVRKAKPLPATVKQRLVELSATAMKGWVRRKAAELLNKTENQK